MYNFKIKKIIAYDGTEIEPKAINIIVGPNNSGKSRLLKEIKAILGASDCYDYQNKIIKKMSYVLPNNKNDFIEKYNLKQKIFKNSDGSYYIRTYSGIYSNNGVTMENSMGDYIDTGNINIESNWEDELQICVDKFSKHVDQHLKAIENEDITQNEDYVNIFVDRYGKLFFNYLGTEEKLLLCKKQRRYGLQDYNTNFLSEAQFNSKLLNDLSKNTKKMFGKDIYLDRYSSGSNIFFRIGENFDFIRNSNRNDSEPEIKLKEYSMLDDEGDGIKNFVTTFIALNTYEKNILLLDEPEAFLHPPLAKQLGEIIADCAKANNQIFIATHSVDLLKGILSVNKEANIIRITRDGNLNAMRLLEEEKLKEILSNSMLMSSNILNGIFCEKAYIFEAESDEEFFRGLHDKVNPYDSAFFTHGKNKQTLKDIARIYKELGIPNIRIYDFDILRDDDFNKALNGFVDDKTKADYIKIRKQINEKLNGDDYLNGGIDKIFSKELNKSSNEMLQDLRNKNIIIIKSGCLETTMKECKIEYTKNKNYWFKNTMEFLNNSDKQKVSALEIYNWIFNNKD